MNVFVENQPAVRHLDLLTHNHMAPTPGNTPPSPWMSTMIAGPGPVPKESERNANEGNEWIEISLENAEGKLVPGARYRVTTPKGKVLTGVTPRSVRSTRSERGAGAVDGEGQDLAGMGITDLAVARGSRPAAVAANDSAGERECGAEAEGRTEALVVLGSHRGLAGWRWVGTPAV